MNKVGMEYTVDKTVSLIYFWLKENKLFKTCRSLEQEYGKAMLEPEGTSCSLNKIIQTYQSLFVLLSSFINHVQQATIKTTKVPKLGMNKKNTSGIIRRRKNSTSKTVNNSTGIEGKTSCTDTDKNSVPVVTVTKQKKKAFMPGVWVCPEMEDILTNVYERGRPSIELIENISQHVTNSKETDKNNINDEIENVDSLPANNEVVKVVQNVNMFTSDSESDSDDDFQPTKTAVKLCNGIVLESPYQARKETYKVSNKEIQSNETERKQDEHIKGKQAKITHHKLIVDNSVENNIKEKTKKNDKPVELDEIKVKKKKSKMLLPKISPVFDGSNGINHMTHTKKKRKPCDLEDSYDGVENGIEESPDVATRKKKKKNHKSNIVDNDIQQIPESAIIAKKKKKKSRKENIEVMEVNKQSDLTSEAGNETILSNLGDTLKKKKKKKIIDYY